MAAVVTESKKDVSFVRAPAGDFSTKAVVFMHRKQTPAVVWGIAPNVQLLLGQLDTAYVSSVFGFIRPLIVAAISLETNSIP